MIVNKNQRQIEVFRLFQRLKRAKPQQIIEIMAQQAGESADNAAFKRAIHRDLKSLMENNLLGVQYFTASGEEIPPGEEEEHRHLRAEYYLLEQTASGVQGTNVFGDVLIQPHLQQSVKLESSFQKIPKGATVLSWEQSSGRFQNLWFGNDDRPIKVFFGRKSTNTADVAYKKIVAESLGRRSVLILLSSPSVSRFKLDKLVGHAMLDFTKTAGEYEVHDSGSTFGTFTGEFNRSALLHQLENDLDKTRGRSFFSIVDWQPVTRQLKLSTDFFLKIGDIPFAAFQK